MMEGNIIKKTDPSDGQEENAIELQLQDALEKNRILEEKILVKETLLRNLIHDIRSPISGFASLAGIYLEEIQSGDFDPKNIEVYLNRALISSTSIVNFIMEFSAKNDENSLELKKEVLVVNNQVSEIINYLSITAKMKNIELVNGISENCKIQTDRFMLDTVIRNLMSNAIKFTSNGGKIEVFDEKNEGEIKIFIKDNGIGLSEERKDKLLTDLLGKTTPGTNREKGTGLGLSLCVDFVERMGGDIKVESAGKDMGTTFIVSLPAGEQEITNSVEK